MNPNPFRAFLEIAQAWLAASDDALDVDWGDDEEFCPTCFAGTESSQHYFDRRCGAAE